MDKIKQIKETFILESTKLFSDLESKISLYENIATITNKLNKDYIKLVQLVEDSQYKISTLQTRIDVLQKEKDQYDIALDKSEIRYITLEKEISYIEGKHKQTLLDLQRNIDEKRAEIDRVNAEFYPILSDISKREQEVARKENDLHVIERRWKKKYEEVGANFTL